MTIFDEIKESFKEGSALTRFIYINLGIFLLFRITFTVFFLSGNGNDIAFKDWVLNSFALPSNLEMLVSRPWALFTYMFLHFDFLHILFNLLWLYWMGQLFMGYFDQQKLITIYIFGGIAGGLFYIAGYNLFPVFSEIVSDSRLLSSTRFYVSHCLDMWAPYLRYLQKF